MKTFCDDRLCKILYLTDLVLDVVQIYSCENRVFLSKANELQKLQQSYNHIRRGRQLIEDLIKIEEDTENEKK